METTYTNMTTVSSSTGSTSTDTEISSTAVVTFSTSDNGATLLQTGSGATTFVGTGTGDVFLESGGGNANFLDAGPNAIDAVNGLNQAVNGTTDAVFGFTAGDSFQVIGFVPGVSSVTPVPTADPGVSSLVFTNIGGVGGPAFTVNFDQPFATLLQETQMATTVGIAPFTTYNLPGV